MKSPIIAAAAALALLLAGCTPDGDGEPTATPTATTAAPSESPSESPSGGETTAAPTPLPSASETTAAPAPETQEPGDGVSYSTAAQSDPTFKEGGGELLPVGVRVGSHPGFERVVFDFEGAGTPGWRVQYVDEAIGDPSGLTIAVDGDATLEVVATGMRYPEESEYDTVIGSGAVDVRTDGVAEVHVNSLFEGHLQAFIGLDSQRPFRVFTLTGPSRLVIDIQGS